MNNDFDLFAKCSLFKGLPIDDLRAIYQISKKVELNAGERLLREGDPADDLFFILEGSLEISKHDSQNNENLIIATVCDGDSIGEIGLLNREPRSASAKAITPCHLRKISYIDLLRTVDQNPKLNSFFHQLASNVSLRLRRTTDTVVEALQAKVDEYKTRNQMGYYLIILITGFCALTFSIPELRASLATARASAYISIPLVIVLGLTAIFTRRWLKIPYRSFGITLDHWKQSLFEGFVFTIPVIAIITFMKWLAIQYIPSFAGNPLFNPFFLINDPALQTFKQAFMLSFYYVLFIPIQELTVRGGLQSLMERFLIGKHKVAISIVISSLMFASVHVIMSVFLAFLVFFAGLYFGWLYSRTHNLISPIIAHSMLGVWGLSILGFL